MSTQPLTLLTIALCGVICALTGMSAAVLKGSFASAFPSAGSSLSAPVATSTAPASSFQASAKPVLSAAFAASIFRTTSLTPSVSAHTIRTG